MATQTSAKGEASIPKMLGALMNSEIAVGETIALPAPPAGWFDHSYAVLWDGNLALVRCDRDVHTEYGDWREKIRDGEIHAQRPNFRELRIRLSIFDGTAEFGAIEVSAAYRPKVD